MEFAIIEPDGDAELRPANEELTGVRPPSRSGTFCAVGRPFAVRGALGEERPDSYPSLAEGDGRLVVFRDGACWPPRLASVLSGGATTCIVVERNNENVSALAQRVVARDGAAGLTLEAVAAEAGISKATVLIKGENAYGYVKAERGVHRLEIGAVQKGIEREIRTEHLPQAFVQPLRELAATTGLPELGDQCLDQALYAEKGLPERISEDVIARLHELQGDAPARFIDSSISRLIACSSTHPFAAAAFTSEYSPLTL